LDQAEELIWSLLDGDISEEGLCELEALVRDHLDVRESFLNSVMLHNDLKDHFSGTADDETHVAAELLMPCTKSQTADSLSEANR